MAGIVASLCFSRSRDLANDRVGRNERVAAVEQSGVWSFAARVVEVRMGGHVAPSHVVDNRKIHHKDAKITKRPANFVHAAVVSTLCDLFVFVVSSARSRNGCAACSDTNLQWL
jgi:hypothetical protein